MARQMTPKEERQAVIRFLTETGDFPDGSTIPEREIARRKVCYKSENSYDWYSICVNEAGTSDWPREEDVWYANPYA